MSKYESTPNFDTLEQIVKSEISQEMVAKIVLDTLNKLKKLHLKEHHLFKKRL